MSIPDLDRIIKISQIFGVSTDYLLRDEMEMPRPENYSAVTESGVEGEESLKHISPEEAGDYLELVRKTAPGMAAAVAACIVSPVPLILLGGIAEYGGGSLNEDMAGGIGVALLLVIIACAVGVFISIGMKLNRYEYLEKEPVVTEYGVAGLAETRRDQFAGVYRNCVIIGVAFCILSILPLMIAAAFNSKDIIYVNLAALLLILVACGVALFVWSGMINDSYLKLLEEGEFSREKKAEHKRNDALSGIYWCLVTAIYLLISFLTGRWDMTWVIWPVMAVLFVAVIGVANAIYGRK